MKTITVTKILTWIKTIGGSVWKSALLASFIALIAPVKAIMLTMLTMIVFDTITGIIASYRRDEVPFKLFSYESWRHIKSSKLGTTIHKIYLYFAVILCAYLIDVHIIDLFESMWLTKTVSFAMALREFKSLIENAEDIVGGSLFKYIKHVSKNGIKGSISKEFDEN